MVARTGNSSTMTTSTNSTLPDSTYLPSTLKMNLPPNLLHPIDSWSKQDVQKWIEYCIEEYALGDVHLNDFEMNGKALLLLTEDNFKQRSSRSGDILYKALQQHRAVLKALHCQPSPFQLWNNFGFPPPLLPIGPTPSGSSSSNASSARRLNIPTAPSFPMPVSPFHPSATGVLPHSAAACMHPAFNYLFNRPEPTMTKASLISHRANFVNPSHPSTARNREMSASSASSTSSHCPDITPGKLSKSDPNTSGSDSFDLKREAMSPSFHQHSSRQPTPNSSPVTTISPSIKQECLDEEDVDIEQHESAPTPPITSSSPSSSPQSSSSVLSKFNPSNNESLPLKIRSQLLARVKQQPNDVTNTAVKEFPAEEHHHSHDMTRQIRYLHDRIDFRGDILLKPPAAKNCRILWEFLYILLEDPHYESIIHWEDREKMIFRIIQADKLAALWGLQKNRLSMTYEKLSRGMRYYYSNNIISKEQSKRLLYRFMRSPEEIRKSMKRNGGTATMVYSSIQKKNSPSYQTTLNSSSEEITIKSNPDNDDNSSSSSTSTSQMTHSSSTQVHNQLLQLFSIYPPSTANGTSMLSTMNPANGLLFPGDTSSSTFESKTSAANDSSDSHREQHSDGEKQHCSPSQLSSTGIPSSTASAKRKQAVPLSLTARLSNQHHHHHQQQHQYHADQPLNLAVHKEEQEDVQDQCSMEYKKAKVSSPSMA